LSRFAQAQASLVSLSLSISLALALALALGPGCLCGGVGGGGGGGDAAPGKDGGGAAGDGGALDSGFPDCTGGTDMDGDGHGAGCAAGSDCDDGNFAIYTGAPELCDSLDNDCDLQVDEGVLNACGSCNANCDSNTVGTAPFPQPTDTPPPDNVDADGVANDPNGDVVLDSSAIEFHFAWIANYGEGTVSKLDTDDGHEVGRYDTVRLADTPTARPPHENCDWATTGNCPSRTAIDFNGDMWVANRAFGSQGTATKIANTVADCIDRNGNGVIDTSYDQNGNTVIDYDCNADGLFDDLATVCSNGLPPEFVGQDDECILFSVLVGGVNGVPRALAIDASGGPGSPGNAWIGDYNEQAFYEFDGNTGVQLARVPAVGGMGLNPYGAAIDSTGTLWAVSGASIIDIDTGALTAGSIRTPPPGAFPCAGGYGIAVDGADDVWLAGWACNAAHVYEPATDVWTYVDALRPGYGARGVAADGFGQIWVSLHRTDFGASSAVTRIDAATRTALDTWDINASTGGSIPVGVGVAFDGNIWAIDQSSSSAARVYVDPATGVPGVNPVTGNMFDEFPVGLSPYTYSDFTGFGLRNFTNPNGSYAYWIEGCPDPDAASWLRVEWTSLEPPGTSISLRVRTADSVAGLDTATEFGSWMSSPAYLDVAPGPPVPNPSRFIKVIFDLTTFDPTTTPVLQDVNIVWECPNPIG
jgi:hypothetical protein